MPEPSQRVQDVRIMLRSHLGRDHDLTVEHPGQPEDYTHTDGTLWTWKGRVFILRGVRVRSYDLVE